VSRCRVVKRTLFLLTRGLRQRQDGLEFTVWGRSEKGPIRLRFTKREATFFVPRETVTQAGRRARTKLQTSEGTPVDALHFKQRRAMEAEAERLAIAGTPGWETDVKPADRFLMERMEVATDLFELNDKLGFVAQYNEEYIDLAIKAADMMAECHLKTLPFNEVSAYLSATSKGSEISEGFARRNAPSLAKLTK